MEKSVELKQEELEAVSGGKKTISTATTASQASASTSTYFVSSDAKTSSVSVSAARYDI